jgi:hypothetical protein
MFKFKVSARLFSFLQAWGKMKRRHVALLEKLYAADLIQLAAEREARKPLPKWRIRGTLPYHPCPLYWSVEESPVETGLTYQQAEELAEKTNQKEVENLLWYREDAMRRIRIDASRAEARAWLAANC